VSPRRERRPSVETGSKRGFTLIELIVVMAVIATLASVIAPALFRHVGAARVQAARDELATLDLALRSYRLDNGAYPTTEQGLAALRERPSAEPVPWRWKGPYLKRAIGRDPWGRAYAYRAPGLTHPDGFDLLTLGRDGALGGEDEDADALLTPEAR
jgi:general secretion pathway protein G